MSIMQALARYFYAPFMMLGLTSAAYWVVAHGYSYLWLAPLLAVAYAATFAAEKAAPFFEEWNDHDAHGDTQANILHQIAYEWSVINGVLLIPFICWLFPYQGLWPTQWPLWSQALLAFLALGAGGQLLAQVHSLYLEDCTRLQPAAMESFRREIESLLPSWTFEPLASQDAVRVRIRFEPPTRYRASLGLAPVKDSRVLPAVEVYLNPLLRLLGGIRSP